MVYNFARMKMAKKLIILSMSWLVVGAITYRLAERYLFWELTKFVPAFTETALGDGSMLMQYSKDGLIPKDYIAILGDSFAYGVGEWQERVANQNQPDYHAGHLLHKLTSRDVVTFGMPGAGSIRGLVTLPVTFISKMRNTYRLDIEDPKIILVYFYEGNDLDDNLEDIASRFIQRGYKQEKIYDSDYFQQFLSREAIANNDEYLASLPKDYFDRFYLAKFFYVCAQAFVANHFSFSHQLLIDPFPVGTVNKVRLDSGVVPIGDVQDRMGLSLSAEEIRLGVYVFDQSLKFLKKQYPDSVIKVFYIPSGLTSYTLASDQVATRYHGAETRYPSSMVAPRSNEICQLIRQATLKYGLDFIDTRPGIRQVTRQVLVHDAVNWTHFNQAGYTALAQQLARSLNQPIHPYSEECALL